MPGRCNIKNASSPGTSTESHGPSVSVSLRLYTGLLRAGCRVSLSSVHSTVKGWWSVRETSSACWPPSSLILTCRSQRAAALHSSGSRPTCSALPDCWFSKKGTLCSVTSPECKLLNSSGVGKRGTASNVVMANNCLLLPGRIF